MSVHALQAPKENGEILAHPPLSQVGALLAKNRQQFDGPGFDVLGKPLQELRSLARSGVLDAARAYLGGAGEPVPILHGDALLLAGHQPELFHPGVWAKNFALNGLARRHGAISLNLVVDNDTAKNTRLRIPAGEHVAQIPFDHWQSEVPFEERRVLDEQLFRALPRKAAPLIASWNFTPLLDDFWEEVCRQGERTPLLGERIAAARRTFERRLGCANWEVPLSLVCQTEAFAWFACHLLEHLPRLHEIYNAVVRAYRKQYHLRSRNHPVPDLAQEADWLEAPLWAWRAGQNRRGRLYVRRARSGFQMRAGSETLPELRFGSHPEEAVAAWQALHADGYKIRTRALTTTLFARLFLGALFVHGLGGGKYDELTDELMRRFYQVEPPAFLVLTGTLLLPFPGVQVTRDDQHRLQSLDRDLHWNPQRHLPDHDPTAGNLAEEKKRWIERPADAPAVKRARFEALRRLTSALRPFVQEDEKQARLALEQTERAAHQGSRLPARSGVLLVPRRSAQAVLPAAIVNVRFALLRRYLRNSLQKSADKGVIRRKQAGPFEEGGRLISSPIKPPRVGHQEKVSRFLGVLGLDLCELFLVRVPVVLDPLVEIDARLEGTQGPIFLTAHAIFNGAHCIFVLSQRQIRLAKQEIRTRQRRFRFRGLSKTQRGQPVGTSLKRGQTKAKHAPAFLKGFGLRLGVTRRRVVRNRRRRGIWRSGLQGRRGIFFGGRYPGQRRSGYGNFLFRELLLARGSCFFASSGLKPG